MTDQETKEILDAAEGLTRCVTADVAGLTMLFVGAHLDRLKEVVQRHRPVPYELRGGKKVRPEKQST